MSFRTPDRAPPRPSLRPIAGLCVALATFGPGVARAGEATPIYLIADTQGEIHLSDRDDADAGVPVERIVGAATNRRAASAVASTSRYATLVDAAALAERLDPALIHAVIGVESAYRPLATSPRGASGLMQLMPPTARDYGVTDIFDPRQNIAAGTRHLRTLMDRYGQDLARALAAYNAGAGAIDRARPRSAGWPNPETSAYVVRVLGRYAQLRMQPAAERVAVTDLQP